MNPEFILAYEIALNNYIVKLYRFDDDKPYVDSDTINNLIDQLNQYQYIRQIMDSVCVLQGITQTEIFDLNNQLLLVNKVVFD